MDAAIVRDFPPFSFFGFAAANPMEIRMSIHIRKNVDVLAESFKPFRDAVRQKRSHVRGNRIVHIHITGRFDEKHHEKQEG